MTTLSSPLTKDVFDPRYHAWNYAIRGKTIDGRQLRVIVSFEHKDLLIITAIALGEDNDNKDGGKVH